MFKGLLSHNSHISSRQVMLDAVGDIKVIETKPEMITVLIS